MILLCTVLLFKRQHKNRTNKFVRFLILKSAPISRKYAIFKSLTIAGSTRKKIRLTYKHTCSMITTAHIKDIAVTFKKK